jgi:hypothetical protein
MPLSAGISVVSPYRIHCHCLTPVTQHSIHQTELDGFVGPQEIVPVGILGDLFDILPGVVGEDRVQLIPEFQDFLRVDVDVGCLALESTQGLVNHHPRMGQAETLPLGSAGQ